MVTGAGAHGRGESTIAGPEALDVGGRELPERIRRAARRLRRRAEVSASVRAAVLLREYARRTAAGDLGQTPLRMATDTLRAMAHGRHARPHRRRLSSLLGRRRMARPALREDALRPGAAHAGVSRSRAGDGRRLLRDGRGRHAGLRHARSHRSARAAFYSAEDADSVPPEQAGDPSAHKSEGAFYIWTDAEIGEVTGDDAAIVRRRFGIEPDGNAPQDPQGEFTGRNLLYVAQPIEDIAVRTGQTPEAVVDALGRARASLFAARERRPRPHLDDKVLTAWNGLMIAAFARAARVLAGSATAPRYLAAARRAAAFIKQTLWVESEPAPAAPLSRRRGRHRRLRRGLRLSDTRPPRALSGRRRSGVARVGDDAPVRAGSPVLG